MTERPLSILICDDEAIIRNEIREFLIERGHRVIETEEPRAALRALTADPVDILILDLKLPYMKGIEMLKRVRKTHPDVEVIMITGHGDVDDMKEAMRLGTFDFFYKPLRLLDLDTAITRVARHLELTRRLSRAAAAARATEHPVEYGMVAASPAFRQTLDLATRAAAAADTTVLILGPSGSGKELIARFIHAASARRTGFFLPVNCTAIPEQLAESEFFGHERGAFTGAAGEQPGCFEAADGGTVFLDEVGDLAPAVQPKILRFLDDRKLRRVGSKREIEVNVRIISATNRNLEEMVEHGRFRRDLFYRLNTFVIEVPPLRDRRDAIPELANHFLGVFAGKLGKSVPTLAPETLSLLRSHDFAGNVRELRNMIERAMIVSDDPVLGPELFPIPIRSSTSRTATPAVDEDLNLASLERRAIARALERSGGNKTKAAALLGISWFALDRKIKKLDR